MEILGSTFDDSVFEESRDKISIPLPSYNAKFCEPEWFCESITTEDELEKQKNFKFRADLAYNRKDYQKALTRCFGGQARCYCYLGRRDQALEIIDKLRKEATNTCHLTCVLNLELAIHSHFRDLHEEILALQHLISLHPYNPWHWKKLAECYVRLLQSPSAASCSSNVQRQVDAGGLDCGQSDITGACGVKHQINGRAQDQHTEEREGAWLKACVCFVRTRLILTMLRLQQASFVLESSEKAMLEADEALQRLEPQEKTLQLITEVMGKDLVAEKMREDNQDGESLVGLRISDFEEK
ncbi:hypothetical protein AAFF_G00044430 [Aldrovandia affinis]|uniref:Uncharacterized protein n=1 Tax=Aldrovandia affinis TaxID=143900 RepID=A0AAD7S2E3_9TELE|nr:hypothetical protein AAFF_G00044430 [Aldrovandia affinis]